MDGVQAEQERATVDPRDGVAQHGRGGDERQRARSERSPRDVSGGTARERERKPRRHHPERGAYGRHARKGGLEVERDRPRPVRVGERGQRHRHQRDLRRRHAGRRRRYHAERPPARRVGLRMRLGAQDEAHPRHPAEREARAHEREAAKNDVDEPGH